MSGEFLEGTYDRGGQRIVPVHKCDLPQLSIVAMRPEGTVWRCGECGAAWRLSRDWEQQDHRQISRWDRLKELDSPAVGLVR